MYINPFICGIIATILAEIGALCVALVIAKSRKGKGNG